MLEVTPLAEVRSNPHRVITVGTFDGVHRGHQVLINETVARARAANAEAVVLSFDPHPREVVTGRPVPLLTTLTERAIVLGDLGVDQFVVIPFDRQFMERSAGSFVQDILLDKIGMTEFVMGYDHAFGRGREGNQEVMQQFGQDLGFNVHVVPARIIDSIVVSSSELRRALNGAGDVKLAAKLLGRQYGLHAVVVKGDQRGRTIGYPTANLHVLHPQKVIPRRGVYAVRVFRPSTDRMYGGMMNIGYRPTFSGEEQRLEVHLFDFDGNLYGETLHIAFAERVREEMKFDGVDALVEQLSKDEARCRSALNSE